MTKEDKELLLTDLCGRLPYGVIVKHPYGFGKLESITKEDYGYDLTFETSDDNYYTLGENIQPYLRPMPSMSEEEYKEFIKLKSDINNSVFTRKYDYDLFDWFNANHFDYRDLIEKGLAIEVTEENNPYKTRGKKTIKFPRKRYVRPKKGWVNWLETIADCISRSMRKQKLKKEIEDETLESTY